MNFRFVVHVLVVALPAAALGGIIGLLVMSGAGEIILPPAPTPLPPTIAVPRGEFPNGPVGLQEWAEYGHEPYRLSGSGFLLQLEDGRVVGVTAVHTVDLEGLTRVGFKVANRPHFVIEFETFWGIPGEGRTRDDMRGDYLLLKPNGPVDPALTLAADPRPLPQPGERVALITGIRAEPEARRVFEGTVQSVDEGKVWVLMDGLFQAGLMSGSPFVSQHTGKAVGMLIAGTLRQNRLLLVANPIGALVHWAETAKEFPRIAGGP